MTPQTWYLVLIMWSDTTGPICRAYPFPDRESCYFALLSAVHVPGGAGSGVAVSTLCYPAATAPRSEPSESN